MTPIDPAHEAGYVTDQRRAHWPATIAAFEAKSAAVARLPGFSADIPYGPHPRRRFDWFPAEGRPRAVLAWFHPGYWQMRDKSLFRCLMPRFAGLGLDVAMVGYPLAPEASLAAITEAARDALPALVAHTRAMRGRVLPVVAAGHSAGGHLAIELATTDWTERGDDAVAIAAALAFSGVYDLEPLIDTTLNAALGLDPVTAHAASPIHRVGTIGSPALFAVGGAETAAFLAQNAAMAAAWEAAGHTAEVFVAEGDDHFSLIDRLLDERSGLSAAVAGLLDRAL